MFESLELSEVAISAWFELPVMLDATRKYKRRIADGRRAMCPSSWTMLSTVLQLMVAPTRLSYWPVADAACTCTGECVISSGYFAGSHS